MPHSAAVGTRHFSVTLCLHSSGAKTMRLSDLSKSQLLALMAVNIAPLRRCSDGLWRAHWNEFPDCGIAVDDIFLLCSAGFVEMTHAGAIVTEEGQSVMQFGQALESPTVTPALRGLQDAHVTLQ